MKRDDLLHAWLKEYQPSSLIDVGAGDGRVGATLLQYKPTCRIYSIDPNPRDVRVLKFDGKSLPQTLFQVILFNFVLHHAAENRDTLLRQASQSKAQAVVIQEDILDENRDTLKKLRAHDPKGWYLSKLGWQFQLREFFSEEHWRLHIAMHPEFADDTFGYDVPRALITLVRK